MRKAPTGALRWVICGLFAASLASISVASAQPPEEPDAAPTTGPDSEPDTGVRGRIVDSQTGAGLAEAPVIAQGGGRTETAMTDSSGRYILPIPPGRYVLRSYYGLYHGARLDGVLVSQGRFRVVNLLLDPITEDDSGVEEYEISYVADTSSAAAQQAMRRESVNVGDSVSAEEISQSGDGTAAAAARRVVGVTLEGGALVVRGLGGRYSTVLVNGMNIPGTDPDLPGVSLDLFPTAFIASMNVSKTPRADIPAAWAGGEMLITTAGFPIERTIEAKVGLGINTQSSFRQRLDYQGGSFDALGFDDGTRELPDSWPTGYLSPSFPAPPGLTQDQVNEYGRELENIWETSRSTALPAMGFEFTAGDSQRFGDNNRWGYLVSLGYDYEEYRNTGFARSGTLNPDGSLSVQNDYELESGGAEVNWGGIASAGLELGQDHELRVLGFYNHSANDLAQVTDGYNQNIGGETTNWQLSWIDRTIAFGQLIGDHRNLGETRARLRWNTTVSYGNRNEPDRRTMTYGDEGSNFQWLPKSESGSRFFSDLRQIGGAADANVRFPVWGSAYGTTGVRFGYQAREFGIRRYRLFQDPGVTDREVWTRPPEELFSDQGIGTLTDFREATPVTQSYDATETLAAAFANVESTLGVEELKGQFGVRVEAFRQLVDGYDPWPDFDPGAPVPDPTKETSADLLNVDALPSATLAWQVTDQHVLRAAYGMTVARPFLRELAPYQYYDFLRERNVTGNPNLDRTLIHNVDTRWEWYFGETELIAASIFYKQFIDPIEQVITSTRGDATFRNAESAYSWGGELEVRVGLARIHEALSDLSFAGNIALIDSSVTLRPEDAGFVADERQMYGQSPYMANLSLRFDHDDTGLFLGLIYNVTGPRIVDVGIINGGVLFPNVEAMPFHSLDFVASWDVNERWNMKFKFKNILFDTRDLVQGNLMIQRIDPGADLSLSVGFSY